MDRMATSGPSIRRVAREAAWAPLAVLALHALSARVFDHEPYVDPTMHFAGGVAAAFFFRHAISVAGPLLGAPARVASDLLAFGLTCAMALFWEFGEFAADQFLGTHIQRGLENTMRDLGLGVSGAVAYLLAARILAAFNARATS